MVARFLFPVWHKGERAHTPAPGDHQGPPFPTSSASPLRIIRPPISLPGWVDAYWATAGVALITML